MPLTVGAVKEVVISFIASHVSAFDCKSLLVRLDAAAADAFDVVIVVIVVVFIIIVVIIVVVVVVVVGVGVVVGVVGVVVPEVSDVLSAVLHQLLVFRHSQFLSIHNARPLRTRPETVQVVEFIKKCLQ